MSPTCPELDLFDEPCGGNVTRTDDENYAYFVCEKCGLESSQSLETVDKRGRRESKLARAGLSPAFYGKAFEKTADNLEARRAIYAWLDDLDNGALPAPALYGLNGRGKSHLLTGICAALINRHDKSVLFRSSRQLMRELQDFENRDRLWDRLVTVEMLALDDLGAEQDTEWRFEQLGDLLDERYQRELPVLVATNFKPEAWDRRFGKRTASRLKGMTFAVELGGVDRRQMGVAA